METPTEAAARKPSLSSGDRPCHEQAGPTSSWQLQDFTFDPATMLGARLETSAAEEALLPLAAPRVVSLPAPEADDAAGGEDVGPRGSRRRAAEGREREPAAAASPAARSRRSYARRPAVCRVPSCAEPLAPDAHPYCFRFRVCVMHLRAEVVLVDGSPSRFCQKCSAFQPLTEFTGSKRTCAKALDSLRLRRPTRKAAKTGTSPTNTARTSDDTASLASRFPASSEHDGGSNSDDELFRFVNGMFSSDVMPAGAAAASLDPTPLSEAAAPADWDRAAALWLESCPAAALPLARESWLKLDGVTPAALSPELAPAVAHAWFDDSALSLEAAPRPGCTLLHLDALVPAEAPAEPEADRLLADLQASPAGPWLRTRSVTLRTCAGDTAAAGPGGVRVSAAEEALLPRPPRLLPLALLSTGPATLRAPGWAGPPSGFTLWLRLHGQVAVLRCSATSGEVALPPLDGAEGAARLWLAREGSPGGASRTVLLSRDAFIAAEVASLHANANADDDDATERLLCALGAALRPGCAPRVLAVAAAEALRRGWAATSARLLPPLRAALDAGVADAAARAAARTLLHAAALSGRPALVRLVLSLSRDGALGAPHARCDPRGLTPLHLAASMGDAATAEVLAGASPASLVAWFYTRCSADGTTPGDRALAAGGAVARLHVTLARHMDSARPLVAELASADGDDEESEPSGPVAGPFDDVALARFLLRTYAPRSAGAAARPTERSLYEAHRSLSRRPQMLCVPTITFLLVLRRSRLHPPSPEALAAVALPGASWAQVYSLYQGSLISLPLYNTAVMVVHAATFAFVALPQLRAAYARHGLAVLRAYCVFQSLLAPVVGDWQARRALGFVVRFPPLPAVPVMIFQTTHLGFVPLPLRDRLALLAGRWSLMACARISGAPIWPISTAPVFTTLVFTLATALFSLLLTVLDRRDWAAWRLGRRRVLAERSLSSKRA